MLYLARWLSAILAGSTSAGLMGGPALSLSNCRWEYKVQQVIESYTH